MNVFKRLKPWQMVGLASLVAVVVVAALGASTLSDWGGAQQPPPPEGSQQVAVEEQPVTREIPVNGRLVFANRAELTFETSGEVGEILVEEGERVEEGRVLARLDSLTMTALKEARAQAQLELDQARDGLERARKAEFTGAPLEQAQFEGEVAKARKALTDAEERLRDFQRNQQQELASARKAKADAELALDIARRALNHYDRDQVRELASARQLVADKELAQDRVQENLANFDNNFNEALANARFKKANAEATLEQAEDELTAFMINPVRNVREGEIIDSEILERLQAAVAEARTNLMQAQDELNDLENNRPLDLEERQAAVSMAEAALVKAKDDLRRLEDETDQLLEFRTRQAAVEAAQATLAQAEIDLAEELEGPDQGELAVREKAVALAQERLNDLIDPDPSDVALQEAKVAHAQARVDDALEELEGASVRAPFDGLVSLLNVEVDDIVNDESRVLEIVAPGSVEVDGLIDATNLRFIKEGARARITIASLPGQEFEGTVTRVAEEPRTERGVLSYPVKIRVDVPPGVEVPIGLSQVTSIVLPEG